MLREGAGEWLSHCGHRGTTQDYEACGRSELDVWRGERGTLRRRERRWRSTEGAGRGAHVAAGAEAVGGVPWTHRVSCASQVQAEQRLSIFGGCHSSCPSLCGAWTLASSSGWNIMLTHTDADVESWCTQSTRRKVRESQIHKDQRDDRGDPSRDQGYQFQGAASVGATLGVT